MCDTIITLPIEAITYDKVKAADILSKESLDPLVDSIEEHGMLCPLSVTTD